MNSTLTIRTFRNPLGIRDILIISHVTLPTPFHLEQITKGGGAIALFGYMVEKLGVIGCGRMGKRRARTISEHGDAELVGVVDQVEEIARETAEEFDTDYFTATSAIVESNIDHVVVCVPNKYHREVAEQVMNAGKNVFCEKPLAHTPKAARSMVETAVENDVHLKVSSNLRYFPTVLKAKELIENDAIGQLYHVRGWVGNDGWQLQKWFSEPDMVGGGTLLDNGVHLLDIYRWFLGQVRSCTGFMTRNHHDIEPLEDNAFGLFEFEGGKHAFLQSSWTEWDDYMYLEIYGSDGYLRIDNRMPHSRLIHGDRDGEQYVYDYSRLPPTSYDNEMDNYIQTIKHGFDPVPSGFDGLRAVEMAYGIYESAESGTRVELLDNEEHPVDKSAQNIHDQTTSVLRSEL